MLTNNNNNGAAKIMQAEMQRRMGVSRNFGSIVRNAATAIEQFLASTRIPCVVIGGKAASAHLANIAMNAHNRNLVTATNDFDVVVRPVDLDKFLDAIMAVLGRVVPSDLLHAAGSGNIMMIGVRRGGMLESLVDIHPATSLPPSVILRGIRYATVPHLLQEFARHPPSALEAMKGLKRTRREHHLRRLA